MEDIGKIDLHRHLEGCVRPETAKCFTTLMGYKVEHDFNKRLRIAQPINSFSPFMEIFNRLRIIYDHPDAAKTIAIQAVEDAIEEGLHYAEFRFNPLHFLGKREVPLEEVCEEVCLSMLNAAQGSKLNIGFILTFTRHRSHDDLNRLSKLVGSSAAQLFCGVDIAGDENSQPLCNLKKYIDPWLDAGCRLTMHCCEHAPNEEIIEAINWGAERIGHGIHIIKMPAALELARNQEIVFEVCPISNMLLQDSVGLPSFLNEMIKKELKIALCSDDPQVFQTSVLDQYKFLMNEHNVLSPLEAQKCAEISAKARFKQN